ncbi:MAG: hypothetical protein GAK30_03816 [Paracidovorax wautersii]|uniref:Uncharacterized protein n=1 Tax=Paracidovorax wautersii TaxID=1177982 RepID=A0A7V8FKB8_9BURK|nr:MAG: hypothetical protein GAK30_03816 [Paracidovorax wautersii]
MITRDLADLVSEGALQRTGRQGPLALLIVHGFDTMFVM